MPYLILIKAFIKNSIYTYHGQLSELFCFSSPGTFQLVTGHDLFLSLEQSDDINPAQHITSR